jgi:3-oxoacyl-[acyl-carrier-protein] synthase II
VSGAARITAYDPSNEEVQIAAEVKDFDPRTWIDFKAARRMSRFAQLAVAAAAQAIEAAGLTIDDANRDDMAVAVNTGAGGVGDVAAGQMIYHESGPKRVSPFMVPMLSPSMAACQISIQNGIRGPIITSVAACASSVQAFVEAQRLIERGDAEVVITGGTESAVLPVAFAALNNMGALSRRNDDPQGASRPFDAERDGFVFGEAAGIAVIESAAHADARGATPIAEVVGGALTVTPSTSRRPSRRARVRRGPCSGRYVMPASSRTRSTSSWPTARARPSTTPPRPGRSRPPSGRMRRAWR